MPTRSLSQAIDLALQHHEAGRLAEAEAWYRAVWERAPGHADARHLLGVVALHSGRHAAAVDLIESAIAADRVLLYGSSTHRAHLSIFHQIDVALDPFPQNGDAITCEALWMGVPVVRLCGSSVASRAGAAMSSYVGLRKFFVTSGDAYVRVAVETGADLPRLARLRSELRTMLAACEYGDPVRYTRAVEVAYRRAWREWCQSRA